MQANHVGGAASARAVREEFAPADFSVVVKRRGRPPKPWRWEIYCACKPVPIERSPVFFDMHDQQQGKREKQPSHACWRDDAGVLRLMPGRSSPLKNIMIHVRLVAAAIESRDTAVPAPIAPSPFKS